MSGEYDDTGMELFRVIDEQFGWVASSTVEKMVDLILERFEVTPKPVVDLIELGSMVYQSTNYSEMDFSCRAAAESTYSAAGRCLLNRLESAGLKIVRATDE